MTRLVLLAIACVSLTACGMKPGHVEGSAPDYPQTYPKHADPAPRGGTGPVVTNP